MIIDVQSSVDQRRIAIEEVGICAITHPVQWRCKFGLANASVGQWTMGVALPADRKGTHMSRFISLMNETTQPLDAKAVHSLHQQMLQKLEARSGHLRISYDLFLKKIAPVSGLASLMSYDFAWDVSTNHAESSAAENSLAEPSVTMEIGVAVTSLCPCSKAISEYGAHNQRSMIRVAVRLATGAELFPEDVIAAVEAQGSSELWALLKRADEKLITERAYDNPKFVEDLVRDVAIALDGLSGVTAWSAHAENFESIHRHNVYARVRSKNFISN